MAMGSSRGTMLSEINVTPLVDVMLVLLIIFMITAPMIQQNVKIDLPKAHAEELPAQQKKLSLFIDSSYRIYLGTGEQRRFIPFSQLTDKLRHNMKLQADRELYIQAHRELPYGLVVKVMAMAKQAGIENVGMITDATEGPEQGAETEAEQPPGAKESKTP